jgi:drug/metabolite transporter (DMT)-like permease
MSVSAPPLRFGLLALLLGNIFLVFGPLFVRAADTGPVAAAFWRVALAAPFLFLITTATRDKISQPKRSQFFCLLGAGLFFAADLGAWHIGILETKLANSNLLANSTSFLLPVWAFISTRKSPTKIQIIALCLAFAGTVQLMGRSYELSPQHLTGDIFCFFAGVFYTGYLILMTRAREASSQWMSLAWASALSAPPLLVVALLIGEKIVPNNWTPLVLLAFCSQIVGQGLMIYAVGRVPPMLFGMMLLVQPMLSVLIGWVRYDEVLAPQDWLGASLIAAAIILVRKPGLSYKPLKASQDSI